MNIKNLFFTSLMIGIICILPSCNDCKGVHAGYIGQIGSQLKKYSLKPGSYWIYQDSASGTIDSQSVFYYAAENDVKIGAVYGTNEVQDCPVYGDGFSMSATSFWNGISHDSIFWGDGKGSSDDISIIYSTGQGYYYYEYGFDNVDSLSNFYVSGRTYSRVNLTHSLYQAYDALIYQVDSVGIIKYVFNDTINGPRTWNLLRYHVINP